MNTSGGYRLSPSQLRVREVALATGGSWPLAALALFEVRGELDRRRLRRAASALVARYEILRTRLAVDAPLQRCAAEGAAAVGEIDLRGVGEATAAAEIRTLVESRARRPPAGRPPGARGDGGPILEVVLFRRPEGQDLLVRLPAFAGDGAGVELLGHRILEVCADGVSADGASADGVSGTPASVVPEASLQYADVAEALRQLLESEETGDGRDFWRQRAAAGLHVDPLPMEREPPGGDGRRSIAGLVETRLAAEEARSLERLAASCGASLEEAALAVWCVLLFRLGAPRRLTVGVESRGRGFEGLEEALGPFARYVPLTLTLGDDLAFEDLLRHLRRCLAEVLPMSDFFSWDAVSPEVRGGASPSGRFFPHGFDWRHPAEPRTRGGLGWRLRRELTSIDRFHLRLSGRLLAPGRGCDLAWWYDARRYQRSSVRALAERFRRLLRSAGDDARRPIGELEVLGRAERHLLLTEWNDLPLPEATSLPSLHGLFAVQAERRPEAVAVTCGDRWLSYGELDRRSGRLAGRLRRLGVGPESLVGLHMDRSPETVVAILGVLKSGGAYVPLDPADPRERLEGIVEDTRMAVAVTRGTAAAPFGCRTLSIETQSFDTQPLDKQPLDPDSGEDRGRAPRPVAPPAAAAAYVIYTSGSTGRPKGVVVSHAQACRLFSATRPWFEPGRDDVWTLFHSFAFDFSVWEMWGALLHGGRLVVVPRPVSRSPEDFLRLLCDERVSILNQTPSAFRQLVRALDEASGLPLPSLRTVIFGGEALDLAGLAPWFDRYGGMRPQLVNMYGITETTVHVTYRPLSEKDLRSPADSVLGVPIPDLATRLLDRRLRPVPIAVPGEIHVGGAGVCRGYLGRPALTAERFLPDSWSAEPGARSYRSGDLARRRPDGDLLYQGRVDHQVKVRGFRIELGEIEHHLLRHPAVGDAAVVLRGAGDARRLVAYLAWKPGAPGSAGEVRAHLRDRLPPQMLPAVFQVLPELPRTASGKLDRRSLPAPDRSRAAPGRERVPPRTPVEETLAEIFAGILGVERVGLHDSFFELGGHSLLATRAIARARRSLRVALSVRDLFEAPTVAGLAERAEVVRRSAAGLAMAPPIAPVPRASGRDLPLSFAQQRLWFLAQLEPASTAYNMPLSVRLDGPLRPAALAGAVAEIVRRHEVLRTTFAAAGGVPVQVIAPPSRRLLPWVELSALPESAAWKETRRLAAEDARRPFDLARGPLLRAVLVRPRPESHVLIANLHHAAGDEWSLRILEREIRELYTAASSGLPSPLPELPVQYADYAVYQRESLESGLLERQLAYWKERLGDGPPVLELPADRRRPPVRSYRGAALPLTLSARISEGIEALARRRGATLFMCLMALFQLLLSRLTGESDVAVGTPISGRDRLEVEDLIGFFLNTLVIRVAVVPEAGFGEMLEAVRTVSLDAYDHKDLPFEELVDAIDPERSLSHSPLFQVLFVVVHAAPETAPSGGLQWSTMPAAATTAKFDLTLSLRVGRGTIGGTLEYSTDLFDRTTARRLIRSFETLAAAAVAEADRPVGTLGLLTRAERHQVLREWSRWEGTPVPAGSLAEPVHRLFERRVERSPERLALVCGEEHLSYGELGRRAGWLARRLRGLDAGADRPVAILLERSVELAVAVLAVLEAGGAYLPLDPGYPRERLAVMLEDAGRPATITCHGLRALLPGEGVPTVLMDAVLMDAVREAIRDGPADLPAARVRPGNLAYVIFTSGSTGRPKGIGMPHGTLRNLMDFFLSRQRHPARVPQLASFSFDASFTEMFVAWSSGGALVMEPEDLRRDPFALESFLRAQRIETLVLPVVVLQQLAEIALEGGWRTFDHLEQVIATGEQLQVTAAVAKWFAELDGCRLHNDYGPSETHVVTSYPLPPAPAAWPVHPPIGRPIPNSPIRLLDPRLEPVPQGCAGELHVGGLSLARGYLGRPGRTASRFLPDPAGEPGGRLYRTGDLARYRPDGHLEYLGRIDHQVKIRGFRVEPGEVESVLGEHPDLREVVVTAPEGERLVAYLVPESGREVRVEQVRDRLAAKVPAYMVPSAFVVLEALPLNANGKVDRRALPAPESAVGDRAAVVAPRTPIEEIVAGVWSDVLGRPEISAEDDFFGLGGHSLLATRVVSRLRSAFGVDLAVREIFEAPTVAGLARRLESSTRRRGGEAPPLVSSAAGRGGEAPLSFAQERMWFLDRLQPGGTTFHMSFAVRFRRRIDAGALAATLDEIVRRHRVLRTVLVSGTDGPVQVAAPPREAAFARLDLGALPPAVREDLAPRLVTAASARPFDLARGPLFRSLAIRLADRDHVLLLSLHHAVSDEGSIGVLAREVAVLYEAFSAGRPSPLPELAVQYDDYARWQRSWLQGRVLDAEIAHWRERLAGAPGLELPTDRPRTVGRRQGSRSHGVELAADLAGDVHALARRHGATVFMTLLAAFKVFLHRYTGARDLSVGTPVAGRNQAELEELIGFFVNLLVLRTDLAGDPGFAGALGRVKAVALDGYGHQELPFQKLVEALHPGRDPLRTPLFQVMFVFENAPRTAVEVAGWEIEPVAFERQAPSTDVACSAGLRGAEQFDLTLRVRADAGRLLATWVYDPGLFDATTVARMGRHFESLLRSAAAAPEVPLSALPMMTPAERHRLLREANAGLWDEPWERPVHRLLSARGSEDPRSPALELAGERLARGDFVRQAHQLARHLRSLGVGPEDLVGLAAERSLGMMVMVAGILAAGAAYLPLDVSQPAERLAQVLEDAPIAALVAREDLLARLPEHGLDGDRIVLLPRDRERIAGRPAEAPAVEVGPSHLACVLFTSGSTGRPKGVAITHGGIAELIHGAGGVFSRDELAGLLSTTLIYYSCSLFEMFATLGLGGGVILAENALDLPDAAGEITLINIVPSAMSELLRHRRLPETVRTVNLQGEAPPAELIRDLYRRPHVGTVFNGYGPTEVTTYTNFCRIGREAAGPLSIGRPATGTSIFVLDVRGRPVAIGVTGELFIGGTGVSRGYLNRPAMTAEKFLPDPESRRPGGRRYRTGDLGRFLPDGRIELQGRIDHQVKVRGFRVELAEIEAVLRGHPAVGEAVASVWEDGSTGKTLVAYVVAAGGARPAPDAGELRKYARHRLPEHMVPAAWVHLDSIPLLANGKVDRRSLPPPARRGVTNPEERMAPRDPVEARLAEIWQEVLACGPVGVTDDFFELGGHSLMAVRLMDRIARVEGRELPLGTLFEHSTVEQMAVFLREGAAPSGSALVRLRPGTAGLRPPLFLVHGGGGGVFTFSALCRRWPGDQAIYGLQSPGLAGGEILDDVEGMAARYLAEMREVQGAGPYLLGGWSLGGVVAFEMARRLRAAGEGVALLALLDAEATGCGVSVPEEDDTLELLLGFAQDLGLPWERLRTYEPRLEAMRSDPGGLVEEILELARRARVVPPDLGSRRLRRLFELYRVNVRAMRRYRPAPYAGRVTLYKAAKRAAAEADGDPTLGWGALAAGGVDVHTVPGNHFTLLGEPHAVGLAKCLAAALASAAS